MKEASTFDGQLPPVCSWCELAVCQVWCNEVHGEEQGTQELQEQHTAEAPLQMCFSKNLGWLAPFLVVRLSLTPFLFMSRVLGVRVFRVRVSGLGFKVRTTPCHTLSYPV